MTWTVPAHGRHTSGYGPRNTGIPGASTYHRGYDIAPPTPGQRGLPVWAVGPGRVAAVDTNPYRGLFVRVRHDDGSMTLYQHFDTATVGFGHRVDAGDIVGLMGSSGIGAGVHLHFECYEAGLNAYVLANAVDPVAYLRRRGVDLTGVRPIGRPITPTPPAVELPELGGLPDPLTRRSLKMYELVQKIGEPEVWLTDYMFRRHIRHEAHLPLIQARLRAAGYSDEITQVTSLSIYGPALGALGTIPTE